jgi:CRISPR-associated protein (TIGR02584 family)
MEPVKNILICVVGMSPQVVTETLYALRMRTPIVEVHEIHIITTTIGKAKCQELLTNYPDGAYYQFCNDFSIDPMQMPIYVHVINNYPGPYAEAVFKGVPVAPKYENAISLEDIRSDFDNRIAVDFICEMVRSLAEKPQCRILASLAGGRKTMSTFLGFAMQLYGREHDKLYHVLIQPTFLENIPSFFYPLPGKESVNVVRRNYATCQDEILNISVEDIHIDLAEIPFVQLRNLIPEKRLIGVNRYTEIVNDAQHGIDSSYHQPQISIDLNKRVIKITAKDTIYSVKLQPQQMAFYYFMAYYQKFINSEEQANKHGEEILKIYEYHYPKKRLTSGSFNNKSLQKLRSKINKAIRKVVTDERIAQHVIIQSNEDRLLPQYFITNEFKLITFHPRYQQISSSRP